MSHTEFTEIQRQLRKIYVYGESGRYRFSISLMPSTKLKILGLVALVALRVFPPIGISRFDEK